MKFIDNVNNQILKYENKYMTKINQELKRQIQEKQDMTDRKNYQGHITASCYLLSPDSKKILLIYNNNLQKYLQPGGHSEEKDLIPLKVAIRELEEEVGINKKSYSILSEIPINIGTHKVPENKKKQENNHKHHDFLYLFRLKKDTKIVIDPIEIGDYYWENLTKIICQKKIYKRIQELI
jgi:8-oxo-dGTP pyrophosphatase MutT (NUDIX family)